MSVKKVIMNYFDGEKQVPFYPKTHASIVETDDEHQFVSKEQKEYWDAKFDENTPISADNVAETSQRQFINDEQKQSIDTITINLSNLSQRVTDVEGQVGGLLVYDGKVKIDEQDTADYLWRKIDDLTVRIGNDGKLYVAAIVGLDATNEELNQLRGVREEVQTQIDNLSKMANYIGTSPDYVSLSNIEASKDDMVIVLADETQTLPVTTIYVHNGVDWDFIKEFTVGQQRDFEVNPINLGSEVTGVLPKDKYEHQNAAETPFTSPTGILQSKNTADAIFEVLDLLESSKNLIGNAVGEPVNASDSFRDISSKLRQIRREFSGNLQRKGMPAYEYNSFKELVDKIPAIPNVNITAGMKKISKLNVTAPYTLEIPLEEALSVADITTSIIEFIPGDTGVVHYEVGFDNTDEDDFLPNEFVSFDGTMHLKTEYELPMVNDDTWTDEGYLQYATVDTTKFVSVNGIAIS